MLSAAVTFCASRVLYQATIYQFIKAQFEKHCKSYINQLVILVLVMDMEFVQRKSLLQEVVQLGLKMSFLID